MSGFKVERDGPNVWLTLIAERDESTPDGIEVSCELSVKMRLDIDERFAQRLLEAMDSFDRKFELELARKVNAVRAKRGHAATAAGSQAPIDITVH